MTEKPKSPVDTSSLTETFALENVSSETMTLLRRMMGNEFMAAAQRFRADTGQDNEELMDMEFALTQSGGEKITTKSFEKFIELYVRSALGDDRYEFTLNRVRDHMKWKLASDFEPDDDSLSL